MDNLRLILLVIGCLLLLGIYLWDVFFRPESRKNSAMLDAVDDFPGPGIGAAGDSTADQPGHAPATESADLGSLLAKSRDARLGGNERPAVPLSPGAKTDRAGVDVGPLPVREEAATGAAAGDGPQNHVNSETLLILYIVSRDDTGFNGVSISKAAAEAGMVYGHMNIFHHFGSGKLHSAQPLFSMANRYEPGAFDQAEMAELQTKGVAVFMYAPAALDPAAVFELFLDTTRSMARALGGDILTADSQPLTTEVISALRDRAVSASGKPLN